jgi:predicted anti-sigma-YlaC factor YlaD
MALNAVADGLSGSGGVFATDDDLELVEAAIPFGLKTYESILLELPEHRGLLLATASGFTQYAYAFVEEAADRIEDDNLARSRELHTRASRLFLRGRDYALRGLEAAHPGFRETLRSDRAAAVAMATKEDVPFLYWAGISWAAALMACKDNLELLADLPVAAALVRRVLDLDETFNEGAAHEFIVSYEGSRPDATRESPALARRHYARALELSGGKRASVHLALAEGVCVREQKREEFKQLAAAALAVDPDAAPGSRLHNVLSRRRAAWLLTRLDDLFP